MTLFFHYLTQQRVWRQLSWWLLLLSCWPQVALAQVPAFGPAVVVGHYLGTGQGESRVAQTAIDAQGYVYAVGSFYGTVQFGSFTLSSTYTRAFVAKIDGSGVYQWVQSVDGPGYSAGSGLALDAAGQVTITGVFYGTTATFGAFTLANTNSQSSTSDVFVAQLNYAGAWRWAAQAGGKDYDGANSVAVDDAGNVYVAGAYASATATFGSTVLANNNPATSAANSYDLFVAKLTPQGTWQWARGGGGRRSDGATALAADPAGNVYLTGQTQGGAATFGPFSVAGPASTNDYVLVAKLDSTGAWLWATTAGGGINDDDGQDIALDAAGSAYVTGSFTSPTATFGAATLRNSGYGGGGYGDIFVAKLDAAGAWQWAVQAGGSTNDKGSGLTFDSAGRLVVAGSFSSPTAQFGTTSLLNTAHDINAFSAASVFLAYLTPAGNWLGAAASRGGGDQLAVSVAAGGYGDLSLGGSFQGANFALGDSTLTSPANRPTTTGFATLASMAPALLTFTPSSAAPGQVVTATGTGFAGATGVFFNNQPAAAFAVQSATRLVATVPVGVTPGPLSVRNHRGTGSSGTPFWPLALAAATATPSAAALWPNPAAAAEAWQVRLPATAPSGPTQAEVRNLLGQLVFRTQFSGQTARLSVPHLAPGLYQLTLWPAGQAAQQHRIVVTE
ncbi:MAG: SBBP repeat-containing protein [Janthinobacterium lividum]